jgi:hypothetical protein
MLTVIDRIYIRNYTPSISLLDPDAQVRFWAVCEKRIGWWRIWLRRLFPVFLLVIITSPRLLHLIPPLLEFILTIVAIVSLGVAATIAEGRMRFIYKQLWFEEHLCESCG